MFDLWPSVHDLWMFYISYCWLIVYGTVDILMTYYHRKWSYNYGHWKLHTNNMVCIYSFTMEKYYLCRLVKYIIISIACFSRAVVLNAFGISFLWPCVSLMYAGYFYVHFKCVHTTSKWLACWMCLYKWFGRCRNWFLPSLPFYTLFCIFYLQSNIVPLIDAVYVL